MSKDYIDIRDYNASTTSSDNQANIQAALDACYTGNLFGVYFPPGTWKTSALNYKGQSLFGAGAATTIIKGLAGQDVFAVANAFIMPQWTMIRNLNVEVDSSTSNSFTRPIYPILGAWSAGLSVTAGQYYTGASGAVYVAKTTGTTGATQPNWISGRASDGGVTWLFIDVGQLNVQNCAFVVPWSDASNGSNQWNPRMDNIQITGIGSGAALTGAIYSQSIADEGRFRQMKILSTSFGISFVPPTTNFNTNPYAPDQMEMTSIEINGCTNPLTIINGLSSTFSNIQIESTNSGDRNIYLLSAHTGSRQNTGYCTFVGFCSEQGVATTGYSSIIMGLQQRFVGGSFLGDGNRSSLFCWDADESTVDTTQLPDANNNSPVFQIWGNQNSFLNMSVDNYGQQVPVIDYGIGNIVMMTNARTGGANFTERPVMIPNRSRGPALMQDDAFIRRGLANLSFGSQSDLLIGAREGAWAGSGGSPTGTLQNFTDATLETGGYIRILNQGADSWDLTTVNGNPILSRLPLCACRCYIKARVGSAGNVTVTLFLNGTGGGSIGGHRVFNPTPAMTTSWQVFSTDVDFTGLPSTQIVDLEVAAAPSGPPQYIDIAWIAFQPIDVDKIMPDPSGTSFCIVATDSGGLYVKYANGTKKYLATYP